MPSVSKPTRSRFRFSQPASADTCILPSAEPEAPDETEAPDRPEAPSLAHCKIGKPWENTLLLMTLSLRAERPHLPRQSGAPRAWFETLRL
jgi:hypothetical protein